MLLAGVELGRQTVLQLASLLRRDEHGHLADTLEGAIATHQEAVALTITEREMILRSLTDAPGPLVELRAVLLREHVGWKRQGLE